jgi:hypothetical protein
MGSRFFPRAVFSNASRFEPRAAEFAPCRSAGLGDNGEALPKAALPACLTVQASTYYFRTETMGQLPRRIRARTCASRAARAPISVSGRGRGPRRQAARTLRADMAYAAGHLALRAKLASAPGTFGRDLRAARRLSVTGERAVPSAPRPGPDRSVYIVCSIGSLHCAAFQWAGIALRSAVRAGNG